MKTKILRQSLHEGQPDEETMAIGPANILGAIIMFTMGLLASDPKLAYHVPVGEKFETVCDNVNVEVATDYCATKIEILKNNVLVFDATTLKKDPSVAAWQFNSTISDSKTSFRVKILIPHVEKSDEGYLVCQVTSNKKDSKGSLKVNIKMLAYIYVHQMGDMHPCRGEWLHYTALHTCVRIFYKKRSWEDSNKFCRKEHNAHLVIVEDASFDAFLTSMVERYVKIEGFWIGLSDEKEEQTFRWIGGKTTQYTNWAPRQPEKSIDKNCVVKNKLSSTWDTVSCADIYRFVCQQTPEASKYHREINLNVILVTFMIVTLIVLTFVCFLMAIPREYLCLPGVEEGEYAVLKQSGVMLALQESFGAFEATTDVGEEEEEDGDDEEEEEEAREANGGLPNEETEKEKKKSVY